MSREDVIAHLGTIAKSGTADFLKNLSGDQKGFAPDRPVRRGLLFGVYRRRQGRRLQPPRRYPGQRRRALVVEGRGRIRSRDHRKAERGTRIVLHLKKDEEEFADGWRLRNIVKSTPTTLPCPSSCRRSTTVKRGQACRGRVGDRQPCQCPLDPSAQRSEGRGISGVLQARRSRLR